MSCSKCNVRVSATKSAVCNNCSSIFHPMCTELTTFDSYKNVKDVWNCERCNERLQQVSSSKKLKNNLHLIDNLNEMTDLDTNKTDMKDKFKQIESFSANMESIKQSLNVFSESSDILNSNLKSAMNKISEMENKIQAYKLQCDKLESEIKVLKKKINSAEQSTMMNNIEIYGIPKTSNENVYGIVKTIARILNCELSSDDIVYSSRKRSHHNNEGNIVVQFNSKTVKDLLINSVKSRYKLNNPLTAKDINPNFSNSKVYLNDQLTQYNKKLFWLAREVTKCYDYEYKWANLTGIFMAKQGQIFKISNLEELQKLDVEKKINALWE